MQKIITKIRLALIILSLAIGLSVPLLAPASVLARPNITDKLCEGANLEIGSGVSCETSGVEANQKINEVITLVINMFSLIVGVVAVIMIILGGLKYITSGGESGNITGAKNTILYAIIGLIIVALSQFIVKFVLGKVTTVS